MATPIELDLRGPVDAALKTILDLLVEKGNLSGAGAEIGLDEATLRHIGDVVQQALYALIPDEEARAGLGQEGLMVQAACIGFLSGEVCMALIHDVTSNNGAQAARSAQDARRRAARAAPGAPDGPSRRPRGGRRGRQG